VRAGADAEPRRVAAPGEKQRLMARFEAAEDPGRAFQQLRLHWRRAASGVAVKLWPLYSVWAGLSR